MEKRRLVAIVGRPNVGKSSIFNRLTRSRTAIVHSESGVTRDRIMRTATWGDAVFELVDTGGLAHLNGEKTADEIQLGIRKQVEAALADAVVALLVVDVESGVTPLDEEAARLLRRSGRKVFVAANKADHPGRDLKAVEFERLGFPVFPVSALHNHGFEPLLEAVVSALPQTPPDGLENPLRVAIVGRPNVGKSSYINRLLQAERLIVASTPGTTRDSIEIPFTIKTGSEARHYLLIDTAGMRRLRKIDSAVERFGVMKARRSIAQADVVALMLDAVQGPTAQDKRIAAMIIEHEKGCVVLLNKWDLVRGKQKEYEAAVRAYLPFLNHCTMVFISAKTGFNLQRSIEAIDRVADQLVCQLPTGPLNRALLAACEAVQPPLVGGRRLKMFYATQVGTRPVSLKVFVNDPECMAPAYREYLIRRLRERFGLEGAPVRLIFVPRPRRSSGVGRGLNSRNPRN